MRWAAAGALVVLCGCASRAWRWADDGRSFVEAGDPPRLPPHRAVERVALRVHDRDFEFVSYRSFDSAGVVRAQFLLESGISVLDVAVLGDEDRRIAGSVFEAIPNFAGTVMEDLRRTWGSRSVFALGIADIFGGQHIRFPAARSVTDGDRVMDAVAVDGSHWLAFGSSGRPSDPLEVTLLDPDLVPQARIAYSDFDEDRVPREVRLVDLRDGHTLDVEVEEVRLAADAAAPGPSR